MLVFIILILSIFVSIICGVYVVDVISTAIALWLFNAQYSSSNSIYINGDAIDAQNMPQTSDPLVVYMRDYNPLSDYYQTLRMTIADHQFIGKLIYNSRMPVPIENLSGMMLLKIYFKRELLKPRFSKEDFDKLMENANIVYDMYTLLYKKFKTGLFIPDMYGYRDPNPKDISCMNKQVVQINELFYFNMFQTYCLNYN